MGKWIKRIIKAIVIILCLLLVWRVWFAENESTLGDFIPTKANADLYKANEGLTVLTNKVADEISEGGYFSVYGVYYTPDTKELQVTVRYNDSTVDALGEVDFFLYTVDTSAEPVETEAVSEEDTGVRLHNGYPIGEILTPVCADSAEKLFYNYEKLIFEGVEIGENTNVIISLCTEGDSGNEQAVIAAHFAEQPLKEYKLSKAEKEALAGYTD